MSYWVFLRWKSGKHSNHHSMRSLVAMPIASKMVASQLMGRHTNCPSIAQATRCMVACRVFSSRYGISWGNRHIAYPSTIAPQMVNKVFRVQQMCMSPIKSPRTTPCVSPTKPRHPHPRSSISRSMPISISRANILTPSDSISCKSMQILLPRWTIPIALRAPSYPQKVHPWIFASPRASATASTILFLYLLVAQMPTGSFPLHPTPYTATQSPHYRPLDARCKSLPPNLHYRFIQPISQRRISVRVAHSTTHRMPFALRRKTTPTRPITLPSHLPYCDQEKYTSLKRSIGLVNRLIASSPIAHSPSPIAQSVGALRRPLNCSAASTKQQLCCSPIAHHLISRRSAPSSKQKNEFSIFFQKNAHFLAVMSFFLYLCRRKHERRFL